MAADACSPCLLVTANVGSIFEDPHGMLKTWVANFTRTVKRCRPHFLALHCQEVGGKRYEESMKYVEEFVRVLMSSPEMMHFDRVRVFLDEDFLVAEQFTALGSFYFIHEEIKAVQIWDFKAMTFLPVIGKEVHSGNIENVTTKEKSKFPPEFFPECKWSRKGFLRTRWYLNGNVFDLINIHLFHDASNFIAMESFPSVYGDNRRRAMCSILERLREEGVPFFVFGDFNFRLNTQGVIQRITQKTVAHHVKSPQNGEINKIMYMEADSSNKVVLTLGKKEFDHHDRHHMLAVDGGKWLREFDVELAPFLDKLFEYEITFPPSYPYTENVNCGKSYMKTRCPAWCDRILLSKNALPLVYNNPDDLVNSQVDYHVVGEEVCMGDHKPVYLFFRLVCSLEGTHLTNCTTTPDCEIVSSPASSTSYFTAQSGNGSLTPGDGSVKTATIATIHQQTAYQQQQLLIQCDNSTKNVQQQQLRASSPVADGVADCASRQDGGVHDASCQCCQNYCELM